MSSGRALFEKLGSPKYILAPMVDQSELAWRVLCRENGAQLCYSPMYHARLFGTQHTYRQHNTSDLDGLAEYKDLETELEQFDRPLVIQFCANDPQELVEAVKHVKGKCDAVDLNLGCPQGIARKGHYGAFLMDEWELISKLINAVSTQVPEVPITAKIRVFEDKLKTLEYAKMVLNAGAQWLTVHGRTREMKGQKTGLADWSQIRYLRDNLPKETVIIANGNIIYRKNLEECLEATGADAVMTAETALANPGIFPSEKQEFQRVDLVLRRYFDIASNLDSTPSKTALKTHMFKLLRTFFIHETDIRNKLGGIKGDMAEYEKIVLAVEDRVKDLVEKNKDAEIVQDGEYYTVPHWFTQPLFRVVNGVASNGEVRKKIEPAPTSEPDGPSKAETEAQAEAQAESKPENKLESDPKRQKLN